MAPPYELGLIGYPLGHSLSPLLHQAALSAAGLEGNYRLFPVSPDDLEWRERVKNLLEKMMSGEMDGLNVTIPHKQRVIGFLDQLTPIAEQIEAVNTVFLEDGKLVGDNTDVPGFLTDLFARTGGIKYYPGSTNHLLPGTALVLGAGGSARAIIYALATVGMRIILMSRRIEQAEMIVESFQKKASPAIRSDSRLEVMTLDQLNQVLGDNQGRKILIVNTTPVGMWPDVCFSPWPGGVELPTGAIIYDLIYNPRDTYFMRQALDAGLQAWNGLGMLVEQAALSFNRWTGIESVSDAMWAALKSIDQTYTTTGPL